MARLVLIATAWGPKHGGINSFNTDLAIAVAQVLGTSVPVVVLEASKEEKANAAKKNVSLLSIGKSPNHGHFEASRAHDIVSMLRENDHEPDDSWWIGHDLFTGDVANALRDVGGGQSAIIHHMDYQASSAVKHQRGSAAQAKYARQRSTFLKADRIYAVGPLLQRSAAGLLARDPSHVTMLIPGFVETDCTPSPPNFVAITFGRLDPENDRIKQGRLAIAAFAEAVRQACEDDLLPASLRKDPVLKVVGIGDNPEEQGDALRLGKEVANRTINVIALPFEEDRETLLDELRRSSAALMLSWHEGFGLAGWEAVAAEVPLVVTKNSGLFQLVEDRLGASGLACLKGVDVRGEGVDQGLTVLSKNGLHPADLRDASSAILAIARDGAEAKRRAKELRSRLLETLNCTWIGTARSLIQGLGITVRDDTRSPPSSLGTLSSESDAGTEPGRTPVDTVPGPIDNAQESTSHKELSLAMLPAQSETVEPCVATSPLLLMRALEDKFCLRWEHHFAVGEDASDLPIVYWPVRLRPPTPIHAAQAFVAAALQKAGATVYLCVDDMGTKEYQLASFESRLDQWMKTVNGDPTAVVHLPFSDTLAHENSPNVWPLLEHWFGKSSYRMHDVLAVSKLLAAGEDPTELLSKKPRRLLSPASVWTALDRIIAKHPSRWVVTLGGYDEKELWSAWETCIPRERHVRVGHLYLPKLIEPRRPRDSLPGTAQSQHTNGRVVHMARTPLSWTSREDIRRAFLEQVAAYDEFQQAMPEATIYQWAPLLEWCHTELHLLPHFVTSDWSRVPVIRLRDERPPDSAIAQLVEAVGRWLFP